MYFIILILIAFLVGLYVYSSPKLQEAMTNNNGQVRCPNILVQKGIKYYLYNSNIVYY